MVDNYKITEEDINKALNYLKLNNPKHASKKDAIHLLNDLKSKFHNLSHNDPEKLLELEKIVNKKSSN